MNSCQQLESEGRLESGHQVRHPLKSTAGVWVGREKPVRIVDRAWHERQFPTWRVAVINETGDEVAFNGSQDVTEVLRVGTVMALGVGNLRIGDSAHSG